MKRSERMKIVKTLAEREEQQERLHMGESQLRLDEEQGRLEELKKYRQSYNVKRRLDDGLPASRWQDYHRFLGRLEQAVATQENVVRDGKSRREAHRQRWMVKQQRLESLSRIIKRYRIAEIEETGRRLEKLQGELPFRPRKGFS